MNDLSQFPEGDRAFRKTAGRIGLGMLLHLLVFNGLTAAVAVVSILVSGLEGAAPDTGAYILEEILYMVAYALGFLIPAWVLSRLLRDEPSYESRGGGMPHATVMLVFAAIALNFAAAYLNSYLVTLLLPGDVIDPTVFSEEIDGALSLVLSLISTAVIPAVVEELLFRRVIVPALCEEFLFRGAILSALLPYGKKCAIFGSAFLFGLMHGNILQILYTVLMGVILGYLYVRTRSIWLCMLIHFVNNAIAVMQEALMSDPARDFALRLNSILELTVLVLGGVSLTVLLVRRMRRARPEDGGSFGKLYEPGVDFAYVPTTRGAKVRLFFSPSMVVYTVLSVLTMAGTFFLLLIAGA